MFDDNTNNDAPAATPVPAVNEVSADLSVPTAPAPAPADDNSIQDVPELLTATTEPDAVPDSSADNDLLSLKKQALEELSPLIDHLDQTPEEKFNTTMMMIQATDSSNLVKVAHDAALKIEDEKIRAQALLDIVNEINYFTQK